MHADAKIRIDDNPLLRESLGVLFDSCDQIIIARWATLLSKHIFEIAGILYENNEIIKIGYSVNEMWQNGKARMYDVRQAGFSIHQLAKASSNLLEQITFRVAGQAIATGHMKEHGMVASDYAIKAINLKFPGNIFEIEKERNWQISMLKKQYMEVENHNNGIQYNWIIIEDNSRLYFDKNNKSQTVMYLSKNQFVRRIDHENNEDSDWIEVETKTKKHGYCIKKSLKKYK